MTTSNHSSMRATRRDARATSRNPIASAICCSHAASFSRTRRREHDGGENSALSTQTMIGYLQGTLKQLDATRALIVAGGVGYDIHISLQTYYKLEGQREVAMEIYT